jgi:hypothetical protein
VIELTISALISVDLQQPATHPTGTRFSRDDEMIKIENLVFTETGCYGYKKNRSMGYKNS